MIRYASYALICVLLATFGLTTKMVYAQDWYPGDSVQEGLLVKYRISNLDFKTGQEFIATLWFGSQDHKGDWLTDVIIEDEGKVVTGQFTLSSLDLTPLGIDIPPELQPYRLPTKNSLAWLSSYASKIEPRPLRVDAAWGGIGTPGGGGIVVRVFGTETIQVAGQSWDTYVIGWRYGEDSKIWIKDNFPLPIKAKVYAIATEHPIPVNFEFELLETKISDTPPLPPEEKPIEIVPPLTKLTTTARYKVDLYWKPVPIQAGEPTTFGLAIFDKRDNIVKVAEYNLKIEDAMGNVLIDKGFTTVDGRGTHMVTYEEIGGTQLTVTVTERRGDEIFNEKATFNLIVVPEFPAGIAIVMATLIAMMVAMTRSKKFKISRLS